MLLLWIVTSPFSARLQAHDVQNLEHCISTVSGIAGSQYPLLQAWAEGGLRENNPASSTKLEQRDHSNATQCQTPFTADLGSPNYVNDLRDLAAMMGVTLHKHWPSHMWGKAWWQSLQVDDKYMFFMDSSETPADLAIEVIRYALYREWMARRHGHVSTFVTNPQGIPQLQWSHYDGSFSFLPILELSERQLRSSILMELKMEFDCQRHNTTDRTQNIRVQLNLNLISYLKKIRIYPLNKPDLFSKITPAASRTG